MKRFLLVLAAGLCAFAVSAGVAFAQMIELGQTTSSPVAAPSCPPNVALANCLIVLTRTTAVQTETNGVLNPTKVTKDGWIVAFTVGLSKLTSDAKTELGLLKGLDAKFGGPPQLVLSVLKPGANNKYTVVAQSATFHVLPFLGSVLQEPLSLPPTFSTLTALPVKKGDVVGLTVLTWAPVLTYNLTAGKYSYRQSRRANCTHAAAGQTAQSTVGASQQYLCSYSGTRVQYSATEVVNQPYPKTYVGGPSPTKKK
ncbi:MAG TPA: hypothetical protein VMF14_08985 [Solirubrobacteraceae bacterium]|nr:hypothetical protein [Solirubrobacteraceae bacterium]